MCLFTARDQTGNANYNSGRYKIKSMFDAKLELPKFNQGRLPTVQYFNKFLQHVPFNVLCDSGSSIDTLKDGEFLTNVRRVNKSVTVLTNGGPAYYDHKGTFNGTVEVWYYPKGIANILSLKTLTSVSDVSFTDSDCLPYLITNLNTTVARSNRQNWRGKSIVFWECQHKIYLKM